MCAALPVMLGGNRPLALTIGAVLIGLTTAAWAGHRCFDRAEPLPWAVQAPMVCWSLAVVWAVLQAVPWMPSDWRHPLWRESGLTVGTISVTPDRTAESILRLLLYGAAFLVAADLGRSRRFSLWMVEGLAKVCAACAAYGIAVAAFRIETILWWDKWTYFGFVTGTFVNRNAAAGFFAMGLLAALVWFHNRSHSALPSLLPPLLAVVLCGAALLLTQSRAGVASAFVGLVILAVFMGRRLALVAFPAIALLGLLVGEDVLNRLVGTDVMQIDRWPVYAAALEAIADRPWLGHGIGSFDLLFPAYRPASLTHHWDYLHNTWLEAVFEFGIPAAVLLCAAPLLSWSTSAIAAWRKTGDPTVSALAVATGAMVGLHALVDFTVQMPANALWLAVVLGLGVAQGRSAVRTPGSSAKVRR